MGLRLIDADALKARIMDDVPGFLDGGSSITKAFILAMLELRSVTPTIDAVPVVRCKDCKYRSKEMYDYYCDPNNKVYVCQNNDLAKKPDWFCADGEQKPVDNPVDEPVDS